MPNNSDVMYGYKKKPGFTFHRGGCFFALISIFTVLGRFFLHIHLLCMMGRFNFQTIIELSEVTTEAYRKKWLGGLCPKSPFFQAMFLIIDSKYLLLGLIYLMGVGLHNLCTEHRNLVPTN